MVMWVRYGRDWYVYLYKKFLKKKEFKIFLGGDEYLIKKQIKNPLLSKDSGCELQE